jgi:hypothetical protein
MKQCNCHTTGGHLLFRLLNNPLSCITPKWKPCKLAEETILVAVNIRCLK